MKFAFAVLALLTISCNKKTAVIVAQNQSGNGKMDYKIDVSFYADSTFCLAYIPNIKELGDSIVENGKYTIKRGTLYLNGEDTVFKKAIIKDGFLEFYELALKVHLIQNKTSLAQNTKDLIPEDFAIFSYSKRFSELSDGEPANLTSEDFALINRAIQTGIDRSNEPWAKNRRETDYVKQCVCNKNRKGEKQVYIGGILKDAAHSGNIWKIQFEKIGDGGSAYFDFKMNLTTGKIDYFLFHGIG